MDLHSTVEIHFPRGETDFAAIRTQQTTKNHINTLITETYTLMEKGIHATRILKRKMRYERE